MQAKIGFREEWTVPELRATLLETYQNKTDSPHRIVGLTQKKIDDLKEKCLIEGIQVPEQYTRCTLMKLLRDTKAPTAEEKVCFGSYKGYMYKEVHEGYLQWAMEEVRQNPSHSPDLARLARWAAARGKEEASGTASGSGDPEEHPVVPLPKVLPAPKTPAKQVPKLPKKIRGRTSEEESSDFSLVERTPEEEIEDLETRLQILKSLKKVKDENTKGYTKQEEK